MNGGNHLIAIRYFKSHLGKVAIEVGELCRTQTHKAGTGINSGGKSITRKDKVIIHVVQGISRHCRKS